MKEKPAKIAVIDDDRSCARALARLLNQCGYSAMVFGSAEEFTSYKKLDSFQCLLLDLNLPGIDGLKLQSLLNKELSEAAVVFLTGNGDVPTSVRAMRAGAVDFLEKPVTQQDLLESISRGIALNRSQIEKRLQQEIAASQISRLTSRELQVFRCVLSGATNKQIATHLGIAEKTVKVHRSQCAQKLGRKTVVDFIEIANLAEITAENSTLKVPR